MPVETPADAKPNTSELLPLEEYDYIIVSFSGGKDSMACVLYLLDLGVPPERIELWHQAVDGKPGVDQRFFDWPCTESYCRAFAEAMGMPILFQWKDGGFEGELLRDHALTRPTSFQLPDGDIVTAGGIRGKETTRLKFPQVSADLSVRWCSAYLKIDVASKVFSNDPRFAHKKTVMLTGERRQESGARARYAEVDEHRSSGKKKRIDQWRAVINWTEEEVWDIIRRHRIRPHPAYSLGWSRVSCMPCIFGNPDQWAAVREIAPDIFDKILSYEHQFDTTIRRDGDIEFAANRGKSFIPNDQHAMELALSEDYSPDLIIMDEGEWEMPKGAFGHSGGPT